MTCILLLNAEPSDLIAKWKSFAAFDTSFIHNLLAPANRLMTLRERKGETDRTKHNKHIYIHRERERERYWCRSSYEQNHVTAQQSVFTSQGSIKTTSYIFTVYAKSVIRLFGYSEEKKLVACNFRRGDDSCFKWIPLNHKIKRSGSNTL